MRYLSLFSGIEACAVAWQPLGWECVAVAEIEPFCCAVLAHHYPDIPNFGDVTKISEETIKSLGQIDLIVFGSPCQDLSAAGKRQGLKGERSGLFHTAMQIVKWARAHCQCRFALWENVPGAFSSNKGADFAVVVSQMAGLSDITTPKNGWGNSGAALGEHGLVEWRVLDAQYFGLAQRRKRVFALVDFGKWQDRPPILLKPESLLGYSKKGRVSKQNTTRAAQTTADKTGSEQRQDDICYGITADITPKINDNLCGTLKTTGGGGVTPPLVAHAFDARQSFSTQADVAYTLCATDYKGPQAVYCLAGNVINRGHQQGGNGKGYQSETAYTLTCADRHAVTGAGVVRRLTPIECERLQGFADDYTKIAYKNKSADDCPLSPRYKALGNSMAVPVMRWIGEQIQAVMT